VLLVDTPRKVERHPDARQEPGARVRPDYKWLTSAAEADSVASSISPRTWWKSVSRRPSAASVFADGSRAYVAAENADMINGSTSRRANARIKAVAATNGVTFTPP
jgi:hypothetical protein